MADRKRILFVCVENSCRSQMAEALARIHGQEKVEVFSAGSRPSGVVNPKAIAAMKELGYDLSRHPSKGLSDLPDVEYDHAITMGCGDACPVVPGARVEDWPLSDPKGRPLDEVRRIRDDIAARVEALISREGWR